jgi:hypothetical protein
MSTDESTEAQPWWKYGQVWLLISGPAIVVVAGFWTLWLAIMQPDPVLDENYYQHGLEINKTLRDARSNSMLPAEKGRNHAATPAEDMP